MYIVKNNRIKGKVDKEFVFNGYIMPSRHGFSIDGEDISNIKLINKKLASLIVKIVVLKKFNRLIDELTELLVTDEEDGSNYRETLDKIEKFRVVIKNKYREFLGKKELEMMSKKLKLLQKEAFKKLLLANEVNMLGKNTFKGK